MLATGVCQPAAGNRPRREETRSQWRAANGQWRIPVMIVMFAFALQSCQLTDHTEKDPNAITTEALNIPASGYEPGDSTDLPRIVFDSTTMHFGRIPQGNQVEKQFRFTNAGNKDLIIVDVRSTCGCTVGKDWPKAPVHSGDGGTITVHFDSNGRSGLQDKTVTVVANTQPPTTVLLLKGEVVAPPGAPVDE
jgi:hypothetical protein